jgi:hypothetical protein
MAAAGIPPDQEIGHILLWRALAKLAGKFKPMQFDEIHAAGNKGITSK